MSGIHASGFLPGAGVDQLVNDLIECNVRRASLYISLKLAQIGSLTEVKNNPLSIVGTSILPADDRASKRLFKEHTALIQKVIIRHDSHGMSP